MATLSPFAKLQFLTNDGAPAAGYQLFVFESGGTTKANTWTDSAQSSLNTNPIILDSSGRCVIYLAENPGYNYKYVMATPSDTDPPASPIWTIDPVQPIQSGSVSNVDITGTAGENLTSGDCVYISQGDGGRTDGRWYKADADFDYASSTAQVTGFAQDTVTTGNSVTIRLIGILTTSGLTDGDTYYVSTTAGAITNVVPSNQRIVGVAASATELVIWQALQFATATTPGLVSATTQSFGGAKTFVDNAAFSSATATTFATPPVITAPASASADTYKPSGRVDFSITQADSSTGGTVDLYSYTIPAGTLATNGDMIRMTASGSFAANGNTKVVNALIDVGSTQVFSTTSSGEFWYCVVEVYRLTATTGRIIASNNSVTAGAQSVKANSAITPDFSTALVFKIRADATTSNSDIVFRTGQIELFLS